MAAGILRSEAKGVSEGALVPQIDRLMSAVREVVVARDETVRLLMVALLSGGHVLLEDVPGVGKTLLAKTLAKVVNASFRRIQFTPDLLPADITGAALYDQSHGTLTFQPGPVFANIVLADEINRGTPRTQSALLEAMGEGQVSADGVTYPLPQPFMVIATTNPVESYGTFPLPEAQLDRFLLALHLGYPERDQEVLILEREEHAEPEAYPVLSASEVLALRATVREVAVARALKEYIVDLVGATRQHPEVVLGISSRGAVALQRAAQAVAALDARTFVIPDDVKFVAPAVLAHRLLTRQGGASAGRAVARDVLATVPVPLEVRTP